MQIENANDHLVCSSYDTSDSSAIEIVNNSTCGGRFIISERDCMLLFVLEGRVTFGACKRGDYQCISAGSFIFIGSDGDHEVRFDESSKLILIRVEDKNRLCNCYTMDRLYRESCMSEEDSVFEKLYLVRNKLYVPEICDALRSYLDNLVRYVEDGLKCKYYFDIKIKELFYVLMAYYNRQELNLIFQPMLSADVKFSEQVKSLALKYKTATELARAMNYTVSGFNKRFTSVFGMPVYRWMLERKKEYVYSELRSGDLSFKELSADMGFCSMSNFNSFCKRSFGMTPGEIRNG